MIELEHAERTEERNVFRTLVREPEGKGPLTRQRHRWMENIKTEVREIG
jgi:proteasome lid subunit RPN8/RPN11